MRRTRRSLSRKGAAGLALASAWGTEARAERVWAPEIGIGLSYHFAQGGRPGHLGVGVEARYLNMERYNSCGETSSVFAGPVARIELVGWDQVRLVVAPQYGRLTGLTEVAADLSLGYRLGRDPGFIVEPGMEGAFVIFKARLAYAVTRDFSAGLGVRLPRSFGQGCTVEGRPLRRDDGVAPLPEAVLVGETPAVEPTPGMQLWAERARTEWASAPAFCEVAHQLTACGAPASLATRAWVSAEDEVRHAVIASSVTAALGGRAVSLEPPALARRAPATGERALVRLAVESWVDGCLGEAAAAARLRAEAEASASPALRQAQRSVAEDEARHAALAWDVLAWALAVGGAPVRAALDCARSMGPGQIPSDLRAEAGARLAALTRS